LIGSSRKYFINNRFCLEIPEHTFGNNRFCLEILEKYFINNRLCLEILESTLEKIDFG
jgi:hypothetical protein